MVDRRKVLVFFSWQNDLDVEVTTKPIRRALREAALQMDTTSNLDVEILEATSNSPGAPYIPYEIADKIRKCDLIISDITPVVALPDGKKCPNPNVTFELGMAAAHLGWDRVVMLINEALSDLKDLPFDFDRHRISPFTVRAGSTYLSDTKALKGLLVEAITLIAEKNPKRPREMEQLSESETKRTRDLRNIKWFMNQMNTGYLDAHISQMPAYLDAEAVYVADGLEGVVKSSDFHLYDTDVEQTMVDLAQHLTDTVKYDQYYRDTANWRRQVFGTNRFDMGTNAEEDAAYKVIAAARDGLATSLTALLKLIRERYIEIDIDDTNAHCAARFDRDHREMMSESD